MPPRSPCIPGSTTSGSFRLRSADAAPGKRLLAVTCSDTADLPKGRCRGLWVSVAGTIKITVDPGDPAVSITVPVGLVPIEASRVWSTGTDAGVRSYIKAIY